MPSDPRPVSSKKRSSATDEREEFKRKVLLLDGGACQVHLYPTDCEGALEAHHVITQQQLRAVGRHDLLWDPRNGMTVCELAHRRHTKAIQRIAVLAVPRRCYEFAMGHGFEYLLHRYYRQGREQT